MLLTFRTAHPDRGGLKTSLILSRCELRKLERADAEAEQVAVQKVLHVLNRAEALSGNPHMDTGDAIAFLTETCLERRSRGEGAACFFE